MKSASPFRLRAAAYLAIACLLLLSGYSAGQETGGTTAVESPAARPAAFEVFVGAVTADKVNVRAGASLDREVLGQANMPQKVFVAGEEGDWYRIRIPEGIACYVSSAYVDAKGGSGSVTADNVNVRSGRGEQFTILCQIGRGQAVRIISQEGDWYAIAAPDECYGWVNRKYVTYYSTPEEYSKELLKSGERIAKLDSLKQEFEAEAAKEEEANFSDMIEKMEDFLKECAGTPEYASATDFLNLMRVKQAETGFKKAQKVLEEKMEEVEKLKKGPELAPPVATGRIEDIGMVLRRPGTHKLIVDGKMKYYLRSHELDLNSYKYALVSVWGKVQELEGREHPLLIVEQVRYVSPGKQPSAR